MAALTWQSDAICNGLTRLFFSDSPHDIERAKAVCKRCPVRDQCLEYALAHRQALSGGVWGGFAIDELVERSRIATPGGVIPYDIRYTTNARSTGATCSSGRSSEGGWSVVCWTHNATATAPTRSDAGFSASRPEAWCPECRKIDEGVLPKVVSPPIST